MWDEVAARVGPNHFTAAAFTTNRYGALVESPLVRLEAELWSSVGKLAEPLGLTVPKTRRVSSAGSGSAGLLGGLLDGDRPRLHSVG